MTKQERFAEAYEFLRSRGEIHTQKDLAERMHTSAPNISSAMKGNKATLTDKFLLRFNATFGLPFNNKWLLEGEGQMLSGKGMQVNTGDNNTQVQGDNNNVNANSLTEALLMTLEECSGLRAIIEAAQTQNAKSQEQIDRLLDIIGGRSHNTTPR